MNNNQRRMLWDHVAIAVLIVIFLGVAVWWLESRFGSAVAVLSLGLLFGMGIYMFGNVFGWRSAMQVMRETQTSTSDVLHEAARALEAKTKGEVTVLKDDNRYLNQMERDAARYTQDLANQRARMLTAPAQKDARPQDDWYTPNPNTVEQDNDGFTSY